MHFKRYRLLNKFSLLIYKWRGNWLRWSNISFSLKVITFYFDFLSFCLPFFFFLRYTTFTNFSLRLNSLTRSTQIKIKPHDFRCRLFLKSYTRSYVQILEEYFSLMAAGLILVCVSNFEYFLMQIMNTYSQWKLATC